MSIKKITLNWKRVVAVFCSLLLCVSFLNFVGGKSVNAATVGQVITSPEPGWQRIDNLDSNIAYSGAWTNLECVGFYGGSAKNTNNSNSIIKFNFTGSKIRLIVDADSYSSKNCIICIDGVNYNFSNYTQGACWQLLGYEKSDLLSGEHSVQIYTTDTNYLEIDAIDINEDGTLKPFNATPTSNKPVTAISLNKSTLTLPVGQNETLIATVTPDNATNKAVTWTSNDPTIATVDSTGKVTAIKAGNTTITATTTDGNKTATCAVTVTDTSTPTTPTGDRAILRITMVNNDRKEYDLSNTEISKFVDWYNKNSSPSYSIVETSNIKPFNSRTDYVAHDKIASFEVNQYTSK